MGDIGLQGLQGLIGSTGERGLQGLEGLQGTVGDTGLQGYQGLIGSTGERGYQGLEGLQGLQGLVGDTGLQGSTGAVGLQGNFGLQGFMGYQGDIGYQGLQGDIGPQGNFGLQGFIGYQGLEGSTGAVGLQGNFGLQGFIGYQGLAGNDGVQGFQGLEGSAGLDGTQGFQGELGPQGAGLDYAPMFTVDLGTGLITISSSTGGDPEFIFDTNTSQLQLGTGSSIGTISEGDTVFIDGNLNVYNVMTVDAGSGITSFMNYTGGVMIPAIEIDPINKEIIMMSGSSITSYNPNDTVFIDANLNVYNSLTVEATTGITSFVCYTGGDLVPAFEIDPCDKQLIMMSGTSITSYNPNDTVFIDANLNVYNSLTVDSLTGITSFVCYTGGDLVPAFEIDPCDKKIILMTGTTICSEDITDTVFIDANLNVGNILTVDQVTGLTSFNFYTGGNIYRMASVDVYGNIMSTGTAVVTQLSTTDIVMNNYFKSISTPYTGGSITINASRGKFGYSGWSSTGSTSLIINNNKVTSDSSVFTSISNSYTSTLFPTILATIPSTGNFTILFSNGVSLNGTQFDIDFFVIN